MKRALVAVAVLVVGSVFVSSAKAHPWGYGYGPVVVAPSPAIVYHPYAHPYARAYVPAPVPVYTYRVAPYAVHAPVYYGRRAVVRSKVYYRGQPVRNYLKAVTW